MSFQSYKLLALVFLSLVAFAGNSVLCRLALGHGLIDASSFTSVRLLSGIVTLLILSLLVLKQNKKAFIDRLSAKQSIKDWSASVMLFVYAASFSYAYISLDTGTGALILFGMVQLSMILIGAFYGNRLHISEWLGVMLAFIGVVYLVQADVSTPSFLGFVLMAISGAAWAVYTLLGRGSRQPIVDTSVNFLRTLPLVIILFLLTFDQLKVTSLGLIYAVLSGAVTSAIGYALWYIVLKQISVTQAAVVQLLVPVLAAVGGVIFVAEAITLRLFISSLLVLGGILLVIAGRHLFVKD